MNSHFSRILIGSDCKTVVLSTIPLYFPLFLVKVNLADMQRFVANHPHLKVLELPDHYFAANIANAVIQQHNSLTKFQFQIDSSEYQRFVASLDAQWIYSNQQWLGDNIVVMLEQLTK